MGKEGDGTMVKHYNYKQLKLNYDEIKYKKVIIWCCSVSGLSMYKELSHAGIEVVGFADSSRIEQEGTTFAGLPVFTFQELKSMKEVSICIATYNWEFQKQILELTEDVEGINIYARGMVYGPGMYEVNSLKDLIEKENDMILKVKEHLADERSVVVFDNLLKYRQTNNVELLEASFEKGHYQYFPINEIMKPYEKEVFVDAGAYDGGTSVQFAEWSKGKYKNIYAMEPDPLMYNILQGTIELSNLKNIEAVNCGAYSKTGKTFFVEDSETGSSRIADEAEKSIQVISIDEMLRGKEATYIKMDIEGAEMEALKGAKCTIEKYHPKLAISVYHWEDDLWKIPFYIIENYPWYRIYIRHYTNITTETIMYAVDNKHS